jgi:subtilase family serine protease
LTLITATAQYVPVVPVNAVSPHAGNPIKMKPPYVRIDPSERINSNATAAKFSCQFVRANINYVCYGPDQIQTAYDITPLLNAGINGAGHTIVIVDAFSSPTISDDLKLFDQVFGLPDPPSFTQVTFPGAPAFDPNDDNMVGWSAEISLDVQWAHAIAPNANIVLVLAKTNNDTDILDATRYAVDNNLGDVISMSFGEAESCVDSTLLNSQHELFKQATKQHITLVASSGDQGAAQPSCDGSTYILSASNPASDPYVLSTGGTNLYAGPYGCKDATGLTITCPPAYNVAPGTYISETAWNDGDPSVGYSGGGFSILYKEPGYQHLVKTTFPNRRSVPDVGYNAGVSTGVIAFWGVPYGVGAAFRFGGTSASAPQWAGLTVLANQLAGKQLGFLNKTLYQIAHDNQNYAFTLHDVTLGNNNFPPIMGYNAGTGWDAVTGLGTPRGQNLLTLLSMKNDWNDNEGIPNPLR